MRISLFTHIGSLLLLSLAVIETTTSILGSINSTNQAWADVIKGAEGPDDLVGTPEDDIVIAKVPQ